MPTEKKEAKQEQEKETYWLIYIAALLSGLVLLTHAFGYTPIQKISARLGIAFLYSACALLVGRGRPSGMIAAAIIWVTVILTFFI